MVQTKARALKRAAEAAAKPPSKKKAKPVSEPLVKKKRKGKQARDRAKEAAKVSAAYLAAKAAGKGAAAPSEPTPTLRMRGLPFSATTDDISGFFHGLQISGSDGIVLGQRDGRPTGEAWVTFTSTAEVQRAMSKNNTYLGSRWIELFAT